MNKIESFEQVTSLITAIRGHGEGYISNFFWDEKKHPYWIASGLLTYEQVSDRCVLMLKDDGDFDHLFYIATSPSALNEGLSIIHSNKKWVIDVVSNKEQPEEREVLLHHGFGDYSFLYRMSHAGAFNVQKLSNDKNVRPASLSDVSTIHSILLHDFDSVSEQIPTEQEIIDYCQRHEILVCMDGDTLCGFIIAEHIGKTWYLRYWYTSPSYRGQRVGSSLLHASLSFATDTRRQMLWVISINENAIKRYEHYGFKKEKLYNYVLTR